MAQLSDKQKTALKNAADGQSIPIVHAGVLRDMGLITIGGRERPGYMQVTLTDKGRAAL